jgi:hypothetical protein
VSEINESIDVTSVAIFLSPPAHYALDYIKQENVLSGTNVSNQSLLTHYLAIPIAVCESISKNKFWNRFIEL